VTGGTCANAVWTEQAKLVGNGAVGNPADAPLGLGGVLQRDSVSLSADGNTAIVGEFGDNGNVGAAWVFNTR